MVGDAMSRALNQISWSPFFGYLEDVELPHQFTQLAFIVYNDKIDSVEHVSHFN